MAERDDFPMLYRIAKSYYIDNLSQEQIAKCESISRPHVSRILAKARASGVVKFQVEMPKLDDTEKLAEALRERLNLMDVRLACVPSQSSTQQRNLSRGIATVAAASLPDLLRNSTNVGVGWGYTIYETSALLDNCTTNQPLNFFPLVGSFGENNPYLQINVIANRFAEKFDAKSYYTIMTAIRDNEKLALIEEKSYLRLKQQWESLDTAIIGLGPSPNNGTPLLAEASEEYHKLLQESGTVGDILASFFYKDGHVLDTSKYYFQISLNLDHLKKIDKVICLAGGTTKVKGIITAARNQYFNTLVTDTNTAQEILDQLDALEEK
ncbi:DNA-binding transcriptional regulator [Chloroflexota bacterium]|nr:DNA-binding transcriptional regulator [Chloroflexota bacterium]